MPISVLEHVKGDMFSAALQKEAGVKPNQIFKVILIPDDQTKKPLKRNEYSDDVKRIYAESMKSLDEDMASGLTRKQSFERLQSTMNKIGNQLRQNAKNS